MRIAIINDIQGNALALEHVLAHRQQQSIDRIICLGDLVSGFEPCRVLELIRAHDILTVRGNMDEVILNPRAVTLDAAETTQKYAAIDIWCQQQLSDADKAYLRALPLTYALDVEAVSMLFCHAAPNAVDDVLDSMTPDEQVGQMLRGFSQTIIATGHMHNPMLRRFGEQTIINPGSVGLPYGAKRPMPVVAEYAILSIASTTFNVTFHRIAYAHAELQQRILGSNMPHAAWYSSLWRL